MMSQKALQVSQELLQDMNHTANRKESEEKKKKKNEL